MVFFDEKNIEGVTKYLFETGIIGASHKIKELHKFTNGNMNFVMRVTTTAGTFIFKQSRPYVEKYPHVDAPIDRIKIEANFYEVAKEVPDLDIYMPSMLHYDDDAKVMILEDLGEIADCSYLYQDDKKLDEDEVKSLVEYLLLLHTAEASEYPTNMDMRVLNHFHIFTFPFEARNDFNLDQITPGLQEVSMKYKTDGDLKSVIKKLGDIYTDIDYHNGLLLHGDFYPGSWLSTPTGIKIIDHEFSFVGRPEFDLGVMVAHLCMSNHHSKLIESAIKQYQNQRTIDRDLVYAFAGVEIMRRIMGLAQLPMIADLDMKAEWLEDANDWMMQWD